MIQLREKRRQPQFFKLVLTIYFREKPSRILKNLRLHDFDIFNRSCFNAYLLKRRDIREPVFFQQDNYRQPPMAGRILTLFLIERPKLFPVMVSPGLIKGSQMTQSCLSPELSGAFEAALLLSTG